MIEEICNTIGLVDEQEKVFKFWHGLQSSMQRALWQDRYNPEMSNWDEVREKLLKGQVETNTENIDPRTGTDTRFTKWRAKSKSQQ